MPLGTCPECDAEVQIDEAAEKGTFVTCDECGINLEIVGLDPVELDIAEEGWDDEDEDLDETGESAPEYVALAYIGNKLRLISLRADGSYSFLDDAQNLHNIVYVASSETLALQIAVEELESLINDPKTQERDLQDFFERNPAFILSDEYKKAHPHIVLTKDDGEKLIPDFALEPFDQNALCDLLELKLPTTEVFVLKQRRMRFSASVMEACAQLREYSMFFDEEKNRITVRDKYGLLAFKPRMFVIIGRRGNVSPIEVRKIEADLPNLHLRTYDDLVDRVKFRIKAMTRGIKGV
jgi:lysine biosynthesis protein LysW